MKYILETAPGTDVFRTAAEEDGSPGCNFLLLRRKIGFLLKIEKEMVEYWTKDTNVFKEVQNMPARTKIIAAYPSLSPAERQAADFILSDPDAVPHLSIKQIAARAGVSMPTVTRLVRRAGYSGFTELRIALAGSFTKNKPVASGDDDGGFFSKLMLGQMRSVEAALKAADEERICALAKRLVTRARGVCCCAVREQRRGLPKMRAAHLSNSESVRFARKNPKPGRHIPHCSVKETLCSASVPKEAGKARSN